MTLCGRWQHASASVAYFLRYWRAKRIRKVQWAQRQAFLKSMNDARVKALRHVPSMIQASRDTYAERSRARKIEVITRMRNNAATQLQSVFRGHKDRKMVLELHRRRYIGAFKMQGSFRTFKSRQIANRERQRREEEARLDMERWHACVRRSVAVVQRNARMWPRRAWYKQALAATLRLQCFARCWRARLELHTRKLRRAAALKPMAFRCLTVKGPPRHDGCRIIYPLSRQKREQRKARRLALEKEFFDAAKAKVRAGLEAVSDAEAVAGETTQPNAHATGTERPTVVVTSGMVGGSGTTPGLASTLGRTAAPVGSVSPRTARLRRTAAAGGGKVPEQLYADGLLDKMSATYVCCVETRLCVLMHRRDKFVSCCFAGRASFVTSTGFQWVLYRLVRQLRKRNSRFRTTFCLLTVMLRCVCARACALCVSYSSQLGLCVGLRVYLH